MSLRTAAVTKWFPRCNSMPSYFEAFEANSLLNCRPKGQTYHDSLLLFNFQLSSKLADRLWTWVIEILHRLKTQISDGNTSNVSVFSLAQVYFWLSKAKLHRAVPEEKHFCYKWFLPSLKVFSCSAMPWLLQLNVFWHKYISHKKYQFSAS